MNYTLDSTQVFGSRVRSQGRLAKIQDEHVLGGWKRTPPVWDSVLRSKNCPVNWNRILGLGTVALVSAAGWTGVALVVTRLLK